MLWVPSKKGLKTVKDTSQGTRGNINKEVIEVCTASIAGQQIRQDA
jgi:hypothetical protein